MDIKKYDLCEKRYLNHVRKTLEKIPKDGKQVIIVLCRKVERLSSYYKVAPVFDFDSLNKESMQEEILSWAEKFVNEQSYAPNLRLQYLVARLSEDEYIDFLDWTTIKDVDLEVTSRAISRKISDELGF